MNKHQAEHSVNNRITSLSVVIPTYNGASWLPETINKVCEAVNVAGIHDYEILVVNDGSTDETELTINKLINESKLPIKLITQNNGGRFVARQTGANEASFNFILFVDTRVFIGRNALKYVVEKHAEDPSRNVWCAHVKSKSAGNIYARFWEAIAYIAWRKYFSDPRDISYGIEGFDDYPKGTTCFFIKKETIIKANDWFLKNTKNLKTSNDDTLLIRHIAEDHSINISPEYWCLYHARSSMKQYLKHVYHRGKVFVDGFLRNDGNRFYYPLIGFLLLSVGISILILIKPTILLPLLLVGFIGWVVELVCIILLRVPLKDGLSLFILSPVFGIFYGAGIWQAFLEINIFNKFSKERKI